MNVSALERREADDRRANERREREDRRRGGAPAIALVHGERRSGADRRSGEDRRASAERRLPQTPADHVRWAIDLVAHVAQSGDLGEEELRALDAAIVRLRFALDRLARTA